MEKGTRNHRKIERTDNQQFNNKVNVNSGSWKNKKCPLKNGKGGGKPNKGNSSKPDVKKFIGASLIKQRAGNQDGSDANNLTVLQKRALELTGAPLINYNAKGGEDGSMAETDNKRKAGCGVYRTQSLNSTIKDEPSHLTLQQMHQHNLMYLHQQHQHMRLNRLSFFGSDLGSLDDKSSSCSTTSSSDFFDEERRALEATTSAPLLETFSSGSDVELELEDEHKYLPTNLFQDDHKNEEHHAKLCATTSLTVNYWENANKVSKQTVRKTSSYNPEQDSSFTLFPKSNQLDLLSSVRNKWETLRHGDDKNINRKFSTSSMESADSRDSLTTSEDYESSLALSNMTNKNNLEFAIKSLTIDNPISRKY